MWKEIGNNTYETRDKNSLQNFIAIGKFQSRSKIIRGTEIYLVVYEEPKLGTSFDDIFGVIESITQFYINSFGSIPHDKLMFIVTPPVEGGAAQLASFFVYARTTENSFWEILAHEYCHL